MPSAERMLRVCTEALRDLAARLDREQSVRGIDSLTELELHPLACEAMRADGLGVHREQPYPGDAGNRAIRRERLRCDVVVTESPLVRLVDPVAALLEQDALRGTLFAAIADEPARAGDAGPADVFWLEIKVVGQYAYVDGVPGASRGYTGLLVSALVDDLRKLGSDPAIASGGILLVLFTDGEATASHDVTEALHRCLDRGAPLGHPIHERFAITDRIGNRCCQVTLVPAHPSGRPASA